MMTSEPPAWPLIKANTSLPLPPVIVEAPLPPRTVSAPLPSIATSVPEFPSGFVAIVSGPVLACSLMPVMPAEPPTARLLGPVTLKMLMPVPPTSVLFEPEAVPTILPVPPVMDESAPEIEKWLSPPPDAPNRVVAAAELIVSLGAAKTALGVVVVMLFPPLDVSATAVAPLSVNARFGAPTTTGPLSVKSPDVGSTVKVVPEPKNVARVAPAAPVNCWATLPPVTVDPLILSQLLKGPPNLRQME